MRLLILGATGGTGRALIDQAVARGHEVTAFVRSPQKLNKPRKGLIVRAGDPLNLGQLRNALAGQDAVLSAFGAPGPGRTSILQDSSRVTVEAMRETGVRRLLVVSVAIMFDHIGFLPAVMRRTLLRNIFADAKEMERTIASSNLDWTIARPPRLTNGPLTKRYRVADGRMPAGKLTVSRADVADFLLHEVEKKEHVREVVGIAAIEGGAR